MELKDIPNEMATRRTAFGLLAGFAGVAAMKADAEAMGAPTDAREYAAWCAKQDDWAMKIYLGAILIGEKWAHRVGAPDGRRSLRQRLDDEYLSTFMDSEKHQKAIAMGARQPSDRDLMARIWGAA